ncbi:MAG: metallophosphoesterase family protein [Desulfobaccales bacterium]
MKIALFADIHANFPALEKAIAVSLDEGVEWFMIAGDLVGFYPFPREVIDTVKERLADRACIVVGNHDQKVVTGEEFPESFSATITARWQRSVLDKEQLSFIGGLPQKIYYNINGCQFLIVHGSPRSPLSERIISIEQIKPTNADIVVFGHTHRPALMKKDHALWVNPGSVGQPRDGDPRGSMAIIKLPELEVRFIRFHYEIKQVEERWPVIRSLGLDDRLLKWLHHGNYKP